MLTRLGNTTKVSKSGVAKQISEGKDFPFFVLSPVCPANSKWTESKMSKVVMDLILSIIATYNIDRSKLYLTGNLETQYKLIPPGCSMGGYGAWSMLLDNPVTFRSAVIFSGGGDTTRAHKLVKIPLRVYASRGDLVTPFTETEEIVKAIQQAKGKNVNFIVSSSGQHDTWTQEYSKSELYDWLLTQQ